MVSPAGAAGDDQERLDLLFDQALARLEDGLPVEPLELLGERTDLRPEAERLVRLAQQVAVGRSHQLPVVPGYTIVGELGQGGMGTVYLARQERVSGRPVALKVLAPAVAQSASARERFRTEARAIASLRHPHIVAVYDVVCEFGVFAYAMEWIDGKTLAELIAHLQRLSHEPTLADARTLLGAPPGALERGTFTTWLCQLGIAIARALGVVHRAGLLHRDVKPANILLRRDGTPLLSDFGLVREIDDPALTLTGHFVGTPAFAAPEQLRGGAALDARTDVYGLGVTLYHALALRLPFECGTGSDLLRQIEAGAAPPLRAANPRVTVDLQTIVARAIDADPRRRYATADELADDLERLLHLQPIKARPAGLVTRTLKLARRNRGTVVGATLGGLLMLLLAVLLGGYLFVVPGWAGGYVRAARLGLLEPTRNDLIFEVTCWPTARRKGQAADASFLAAPLADYAAALRLQPTQAAIRLERDTVQLARDLLLRPDAPVRFTPRLRQHAALSCTYAARWVESTAVPQLEPLALERASPTELRTLGLLAYLCGDINMALEAWSRLDLVQDPDPLVEASLGQLYLLLDQPARAYPRLRTAQRAFPEAGFLCVSLADAALQCGDFAKAEALLTRAPGLSHRDPTRGLERVLADLYAATGRDELALAIWTSLPVAQAVMQCHYGEYLESHGDLEGATRAYGFSGGAGPYRRAWDGFRRTAPPWWNGLPPGVRWQTLRASLDESPAGRDGRSSLPRILLDYLRYALSPTPGEPTRAVPETGSLDAIARGFQATTVFAPRWGFVAYPDWLKDVHTTVLLSPWPVSGSLTVAALDAVGRRLALPGW